MTKFGFFVISMKMRNIIKIGRLLLSTTMLILFISCSGNGTGDKKKVIVLAFDGMDPRIVRSMFKKGKLQHFQQVAEMGGFKNLWSSIPPQSPVAWSNFITGKNPGGHAIFDFIHRDPETYMPHLSMSETIPPKSTLKPGSYVFPLSKGQVILKREGKAFWEYLVEKEITSVIFKIPSNYPPVEAGNGSVSGMGTPDLLGTYGTYQYFTTDRSDIPDDYSGARLTLVDIINGGVEEVIEGPPNSFLQDSPTLEIPFRVWIDPENPVIRIDLPDQEIILNQGEWSDWVVLSFKPLPFIPAMTGICRFFVREVHPYFKLYITPLNIDPKNPILPIDYPGGFAREIADNAGYFYTQGMPEDTKTLTNNTFTTREFYVQSQMVLDERDRLFDYLFGQFQEGLFFFYYSSTDLGAHIFWHLRDKNHPAYDPVARAELGDVIEEIYQRMDGTVAKVLEHLDDDTTLIIMSDHGFSPFYKNFHLNSWLERNGYLVLNYGKNTGSLLAGDVDWSRTRAYALGFNALYINQRGREGQGIVSPGAERDRLVKEIAGKLIAVRDPENKKSVIKRVHHREEVYKGPYVEKAPDLMVGYDWGYRTSWESALGDITDGELVTESTEKWSGDHCGATEIVPGILFSNKKILMENPHLYDLSPSILALFGINKPADMIGRDVFSPARESIPEELSEGEKEKIKSLDYI
ncbi:MAG: alkaline phosphatase family protein [Candidatus Auribacterota bacterium]|nr:alkaline phosphatase family protein [Candidatus Auribacterota bacterium]